MKKHVNNFEVTGFVAVDADIRQLASSSVARFPLSIAQTDNSGKEPKRISALVSVEMWRKNENAEVMEQLNKGTLVTVKGFFKPTEWVDKETGELRQRIILAATEVCILDTNEDAPEETEKPKGRGRKKQQ